jgi:putative ubiquitin-RnfH superfamily antitoxin RatB of RatAB toxin-antitoxin module
MTNQKAFSIWVFIGMATSLITGAILAVSKSIFSKETAIGVVVSALVAIIAYALAARSQKALEQVREVRIAGLELKLEQEPEKVKFAWDLARITLETYFDRNLNQVRMIFFVAIAVMVAGFGFVLWGIKVAVQNPESVKIAIIASASGILTQFIGLTFMAIYRSTMLQAGQFMKVLERINTVGMAVQILDTMKDTSSELKDLTRVDIIRLLLASPGTQLSLKARSRKGKSTDGDKNPGI